jgi:branched-chain amino acid aminotransferase
VLPGITRETVMTLGEELGYKIVERDVPRENLYIADEVFFTGTAAEITPIRSIDKIAVGSGRRGSVTEELQKIFFAHVEARADDDHGWLTPVYEGRATAVAAEASESVA